MLETVLNDQLSHKLFGSLLGAIAHLIYSSPKTLKDAVSKFIFALIAGTVLYFIPGEMMNWVMTTEKRVAGALLMGFTSGYLAGPLISWAVSKTKV